MPRSMDSPLHFSGGFCRRSGLWIDAYILVEDFVDAPVYGWMLIF